MADDASARADTPLAAILGTGEAVPLPFDRMKHFVWLAAGLLLVACGDKPDPKTPSDIEPDVTANSDAADSDGGNSDAADSDGGNSDSADSDGGEAGGGDIVSMCASLCKKCGDIEDKCNEGCSGAMGAMAGQKCEGVTRAMLECLGSSDDFVCDPTTGKVSADSCGPKLEAMATCAKEMLVGQ